MHLGLGQTYNMGSLDTLAMGFCEWVTPLWYDPLYYCEKKYIYPQNDQLFLIRAEQPAPKQQALRQMAVSYIRWKILQRAIPLRKLDVRADCQES